MFGRHLLKKQRKCYFETFLTLQNIETARRTYNAHKSALTVACRHYLLRVTIISAPPRKKANTGCCNFLGAFFQDIYLLISQFHRA